MERDRGEGRGTRFAAVLFALLFLLATFIPASAQSVPYTVTNLGLPPGADSAVGVRMNNSGEVVGWAIYYGQLNSIQGWLWTPDGGFTILPTPPGMPYGRFSANDISDNGIIVGDDGYDAGLAWRYENGQFTTIGPLNGLPICDGVAVNNSGDVVGTAKDAQLTTPDDAFLDGAGIGLMDLTPGSAGGRAVDINETRQVAGYSQGPVTAFEAFRWDAVNGTQFLGTSGLAFSYATRMNELGQVVGYSLSATGFTYNVWLYTDGVGQQVITVPAGSSAGPSGINNLGQVVGTTQATGGNFGWLWTPTDGARAIYELYDFVSAGYSAVEAFDINDAGQILAHAWDNNAGEFRMLLLTPDGNTSPVAVPDVTPPSRTLTLRLSPNPTRGPTTISLDAPAAPTASVRIFDVAGRLVRTLDGARTMTWDGRDATGRAVPGAVYLVRASAGPVSVTEKLVLVR